MPEPSATDMQCLRSFAASLFSRFRERAFDGVGISRDSYGSGETAALDLLRYVSEAEGLVSRCDAAGNLVLSDPREGTGPAVWVGSHIDSVPQGGNFDGLAGIVAGLLLLVEQRRTGTRTLPIRCIAFRGEESAWFGRAHVGSGALFGKVTPSDLALTHRLSGETLGQCMRDVGADVEAIAAQQILIDKSQVKAYVELHIEQGPVLVERNLPLAVVSSIRGNVRHARIECFGDAQHSGVVPRGLRHDAVFAVADLIMRLDGHWAELLRRGEDLVVTSGIVQTNSAEHAISRVPGHVAFSLEARSADTGTLKRFHEIVLHEIAAVEQARGVRFALDDLLASAPAQMDTRVSARLARACIDNAIDFDTVPSGAGHDASVLANAGIPSGMLFVRNLHGSHNPDEDMDIDDFMLAVQVLRDAIRAMAS